jgi:polyisoprenyl-teichoic acid--peptidoglycan teichoic acid transferase
MDIKKITKTKSFFSSAPYKQEAFPVDNAKPSTSLNHAPAPKNNFNLISSSEKKKIKKKKSFCVIKIALFFLAVVFALFFSVGSFFIYKINLIGKKVNPSSTHSISLISTFSDLTTRNYPKLKSSQERINILLLGIAGEKKPGQNLTDTIMILSIDIKSHHISLLSLPRDLFVKIPDTGAETKINSVYQLGLNSSNKDSAGGAALIEKTIEDITSLNINYYVILNFDGFEEFINAIDGINIINERDIYDSSYPGANYSYETFELKKGFQQLDGKTALKYVRERHDDPEGDFGRAKRQQQVMQAVKNKFFSVNTLFNIFTLNKIFDTLGNNIKTNIEPREIESFFELSKKLDTQNINNVVVDAWNKKSFLKVAHVAMGDANAFVLVPKIGNYSEIQDMAQNIFNLNEIKRRKEEIQKENAEISIINFSGDASLTSKVKKVLMEHLNYKNIEEIFPKNNSPEDKTFVYDLSGKSKPFTTDELLKTLPAILSAYNQKYDTYFDNQKNHPDIIIGLGKDIIQKYNIKEGTIEDWQKAQE